ncbi:glycosyltransferase family 2 protein [Massilia genomosp. 1]|uniref:Glycosyltransferase n=1 Tax=Massilia genomosp. 1 TaxID=2609280 RepID=A0ABX0MQ74_9BURK|nr:glycosyltransferase family 2 protein [Massilia genomosp. 1]NHZ64920.1 glycosyltransferase [Massilia genomosp. 1]
MKKKHSTPDRWIGEVEGIHEGLLYGWAADTTNTGARVVVDVRLHDESVATTVADIARHDLAARLREAGGARADHCHGFAADLRELDPFSDGGLTVHIANTSWMLPGRINRSTPQAIPPAAMNQVSSDGGLRLQGWACPLFSGAAVRLVRAYEDERMLAETRAAKTMPGLRGSPAEQTGFQLDLPAELADGRRHVVHVVDENGIALNGSPVTICCALNGASALIGPATQLLHAVIDNYERRLPRSLGMDYYAAWSAAFEKPADACQPPLIERRVGIIVTGSSDSAALERTIASLNAQSWPVANLVAIAAGSTFNAALQAMLTSDSDVIACVRSGDTIPVHAIARGLDGFSLASARVVYTDSESAGQPWFKPAWSPDYALASDYPLELMLVDADVARKMLGKGPVPSNAAQFAWHILAQLWPCAAESIVHVPRVLYRFETPLTPGEQQQRYMAAAQALASTTPRAALLPLRDAPPDAGFIARRPVYPLTSSGRNCKVTFIIPTRDRIDLLQRCLDSIARHTKWDGLDIIIVDNGSVLAESKQYFLEIAVRGVTVIACPGPFNYAALNNTAVAHATGEIIGLINNDIEALHDGWLEAMLENLLRPGVGAVGAKLLWPNGMVQHGGVLLGVSNVAGHFGNNLADGDWGDHGRNQLSCEVSAVTAACLLIRKTDYEAVGGMDEHAFPVAFNDVDLCLKLRAAGKTIVWTPAARLLHAESASRGSEDSPQKRSRAQREIEHLRQRWGPLLLRDPAYHPSLNLEASCFAFSGLAFPPRPREPRQARLHSALACVNAVRASSRDSDE